MDETGKKKSRLNREREPFFRLFWRTRGCETPGKRLGVHLGQGAAVQRARRRREREVAGRQGARRRELFFLCFFLNRCLVRRRLSSRVDPFYSCSVQSSSERHSGRISRFNWRGSSDSICHGSCVCAFLIDFSYLLFVIPLSGHGRFCCCSSSSSLVYDEEEGILSRDRVTMTTTTRKSAAMRRWSLSLQMDKTVAASSMIFLLVLAASSSSRADNLGKFP